MSDLLKQLENNLELHEFPDLRSSGLELLLLIRKQIAELEDDSFKLQCLENAGVDNWDGYDYAMEEYYAENPDD